MLRTLAELECGHILTVQWSPVPPEFVPCIECVSFWDGVANVRLFAVECREWKVSCKSCTYARFTGADQSECLRLAARHTGKTGHESFRNDLQLVEQKRDLLRDAYGRSVKPFIRDSIKPVAKGFAGRPRMLSPAQPDIPPF